MCCSVRKHARGLQIARLPFVSLTTLHKLHLLNPTVHIEKKRLPSSRLTILKCLLATKMRLEKKKKEGNPGEALMPLSSLSQSPWLQPDTRFCGTPITDAHGLRPGNCLFVSRGRLQQSVSRKCICEDTEVHFRSKPLILKRPLPSFYPLGEGISVIEDHYRPTMQASQRPSP